MGLHRGYIGIILGIYGRCIGIMEKNMETTICGGCYGTLQGPEADQRYVNPRLCPEGSKTGNRDV